MKRLTAILGLLGLISVAGLVSAMAPIYADGELAPLGAPDGVLNAGDLLISTRLAAGILAPTDLELGHGDLYPVNAPDGVINIQDLILLQQRLLEPGSRHIELLDLFVDGPALLTAEVNGSIATTAASIHGWTGGGAYVVNNPGLVDP